MNDSLTLVKQWLGNGSLNFFGMPFAGKNTQADIFVELFDAELIASGDIFRAQSDNQELQAIMATGANIPSSMFFDIVLPYFQKADHDGRALILSEVGRKDGEQEIILQATIDSGHPTKAVILLALSEEDVWRRFDEAKRIGDRGARQDDSDRKIVSRRLEVFRTDIVPVIEFYRQKGLLVEIDGTLPPQDVTAAIITALAQRAEAGRDSVS